MISTLLADVDGMEELLHALRRGEVSMREVSMQVRPVLVRRAHWLMNHGEWQAVVGPEDLASEMELMAYRAVDRWDPKHGYTLAEYVDFQTGRYGGKVLRKARGYPDPRRKPKGQCVYIADMNILERDGQSRSQTADRVLDRLLSRSGSSAEVNDPEQMLMMKERFSARAERLMLGLGTTYIAHVMRYVMEGYKWDEAADMIYANPRFRKHWRLENQEHARHAAYAMLSKVRRVIRRMDEDEGALETAYWPAPVT